MSLINLIIFNNGKMRRLVTRYYLNKALNTSSLSSTMSTEKIGQDQPIAPSSSNPSLEKGQSVNETDRRSDVQSGFKDVELITSNTSVEFPKSRGVRRIENVRAMMRLSAHGTWIMAGFITCLLIIAIAYTIENSTTPSYQVPAASSFLRHSMISTLGIATAIIGSVMKPFLAKLSDITSRPTCYLVSMMVYTLGAIVTAASPNIAAYIVGEVFTTVGSQGIIFLNGLIVADLTPLKWRGFAKSIIASPYLITVWFAGLIYGPMVEKSWRWGYGMFAIIIPVAVAPAVGVLYFFEHKAQKLVPKEKKSDKSVTRVIWDSLIEIDALGLILMGFGWSLLLLPFSLYTYANNGWRNPSIIAMIIVGGILLIVFTVYEILWAPFPSMPKRILYNKTFLTCVVIDFIYQFVGGIRGQFLTTIIWVSKDLTYQTNLYFNNTLTMSLCFFGIVAGVICRITHRYKWLQFSGIFIRMVAYTITVRPHGQIPNLASFIMAEALVGLGGAFSVIGTQTSSEASVPHQDLGLVIATLALWSSIGAAIGSAISAPIWNSKLPGLLREYLPALYTDQQVYDTFTGIFSMGELPFSDEGRQGAIRAISYVSTYLLAPAPALEFISVCVSLFQTNYYLGDNQNAIENQNGMDPTNPNKEKYVPQTRKEKFLYLFS